MTGALGIADAQTLRQAGVLDLQFKQPVFPDTDYVVSQVASADGRMRIEVTGRGKVALTVAITADIEGTPFPEPSKEASAAAAASPRRYTLEELARGEVSVTEHYACRLDLLSDLASDLGAGHVPGGILGWLSAASYAVGMLVPGEHALFAGGRLARASAPRSGTLTVSVGAVDERTGLVVLDAALDEDQTSARMSLQTFVRPEVPPAKRSAVARYLAPSDALSDQNILIVGSSRGLGAALCGAFATLGANVWVGFARSAGDAENLRSEFGAERIHLLQFDAENLEQTREAFETLRTRVARLDGIVLCAAPPLFEAALHPDASEATLRFLDSSLAMALLPLAESIQMLAPDGVLVVMSSAALDDPPEAWPHYVVAKAALEGVATYCARQTARRVLIVRAPRMWTQSTNTPLGRIGAVPKEQVAAGIAKWALRATPSTTPRVITADELLDAAPEPDTARACWGNQS